MDKFQNVARTISRHQSHQSKRPVRNVGFASLFPRFLDRQQTDLEEEIKVAAFSHGCDVRKEERGLR